MTQTPRTCAFDPCDTVPTCCLDGGCINTRFPPPKTDAPPLPKTKARPGRAK